MFTGKLLLVTALRANAVDHPDSAERAAIHGSGRRIFLRSRIDTACKGDLGNIQFVFQQIVDDLDHAFHAHGLFGHNKAAVRLR